MVEIPLLPLPNQEVLVTIGDQDCTLHVYQRGERLYMDLALDGETLRQGAVCLPGVNVCGAPYPFTGVLFFADILSLPDKQQPPHYSLLGERFFLYYATDEEAAEMLAEDTALQEAVA